MHLNKTKLLILTNSFDGTTDTLVRLCTDRGIDVFRWNMDLWKNYQTIADSNEFILRDDSGREVVSSNSDLIGLWRKPFVQVNYSESPDVAENFAREQLRVYLRSLSRVLAKNRKLRLVDPFLEVSFSKLDQLMLAKKYFDVPNWKFVTSDFPDFSEKMVVKPIGYPMLTNGKTVFTNLASPSDLQSPYPWLFQEAITGGLDITCVFIEGKCSWFKSSFDRSFAEVDWRKQIQTENEALWTQIAEEWTVGVTSKVEEFMSASKLKYGRLDFILDSTNKLWFLECNVNGEFGWLDNSQSQLHVNFLDAVLNEANEISLDAK